MKSIIYLVLFLILVNIALASDYGITVNVEDDKYQLEDIVHAKITVTSSEEAQRSGVTLTYSIEDSLGRPYQETTKDLEDIGTLQTITYHSINIPYKSDIGQFKYKVKLSVDGQAKAIAYDGFEVFVNLPFHQKYMSELIIASFLGVLFLVITYDSKEKKRREQIKRGNYAIFKKD